VFSIYSDRSFLGSAGERRRHPFADVSGDALPHVPILVPFWGETPEAPGDPVTGRYARFAEVGRSFLRLTSLEECDAAVFPQSWAGVVHDPSAFERARHFQQLAREAQKPTVVFFWSDRDDAVPLDAVVFRTSLYRSRRRAREFAQPAWSEDFAERYLGSEISARPRRPRPLVGFCGFSPTDAPSPTSLRRRARRLAGNRKRALQVRLGRLSPGHSARARALRSLASSSLVDTNFVLRGEFMGGAILDNRPDAAALQRVRADYVRNMVESDYVLCARGAGNFSYRLYETLSCGRIPVFVDTDCVLPLDFAVRWRDFCVWVDERDLESIGDRVAEFHEGLSDGEFAELQRECRRLWETHVSPQGFFSHFHLHF
jgi:hypothetical protein